MAQFRKKPVVIDAVQWRGPNKGTTAPSAWFRDALMDAPAADSGEAIPVGRMCEHEGRLAVRTLEGVLWGSPGDWIIRGVKGELYPVRADIFEATYEAV